MALARWPRDEPTSTEFHSKVRTHERSVWLDRGKRVLKLLRGDRTKRDQPQIISEYDRQWRKKGWEKYRPRPLNGQGGPWVWGDRRLMLSNEAGAAVRLIYLENAISSLSPKRVLEVGCGNGLNLLLLSARLPEVTFAGVEPTTGGVEACRAVIHAGTLPEALQAFAPFPLRDIDAVARVSLVQGSGAALPFPDATFDVVFTSLALEQMEDIRDMALRELVRVSSHYVVMLEPFREVNASGMSRRYVKTYDYFQGAVADLPGYGLEVIDVVNDMPHKAWLGTALVIARKAAA